MKRLLLSLICCAGVTCPVHLPAQASRDTAPSAAALADLQKGTEALRANQPDEAVLHFEKVTQESPRFAEAYLNLGLAYSQLSKNQEAVSALKKGIQIKPSMRGAHLFLAIAEYRLGLLAPAAADVRKETSASAHDAQAWMWQGIIDLSLEHLTQSVEDLDHASTLDPDNVDILYHRGRAALALSRQSYETMFKLDPKSWHVNQVVAEADVESGNDADAVEQFKLAIASAPPQSGLYEALGSSYWRTGKYDEAQQAYETALKVDPNDMLALYKLGCLRVDRSDAAGGKMLLERVAVADPSLTMTSYYLGRAELQLGQDQAAAEHFQKTIQENLDDDTTKQVYFQLSRVYRRMHNLQAAAAAEAQYRLLEKRGKDNLQERMSRRQLRADRDASIPVPPDDKSPANP